MSTDTHYDVIIIGSDAGGGTLAYRLAPSGQRAQILERGVYVPRERESWDTLAVNKRGRYNTKEVRGVLAHGGPFLLPELGEALGRYTHDRLVERGVEIELHTRVTEAVGDTVTLAGGRTLDAGTIVWTAGNATHPLLAALPGARGDARRATSSPNSRAA